MFDHPITFRPLFMERIWGGRKLADTLHKPLPLRTLIGESWELVDRPEAQSVIDHDGDLAGQTLHDLWMHHRHEVFGQVVDAPRFPLLAKILDARDTLSVQVHPPASIAPELGGEPKTEIWYVLDAEPGAEFYAGFRPGVDRAAFEAALAKGTTAELLHRLPVQAGDAIFIPSGRCHAIGAGCLIVELQQNSDTTYRVFDWNRLGPDGKPRALHVQESLQSIDFTDHAPALIPRAESSVSCPPAEIHAPHDPRPDSDDCAARRESPDRAAAGVQLFAACEYFQIEHWTLDSARADTAPGAAIFTVLTGAVRCGIRTFHPGEFFLLPATARDRTLHPTPAPATVLRTIIPPV